MIYLDYAATTPISNNALLVFNEASKNYFGNANSLHDSGTKAKDLLEQCKAGFADLIHAFPNEILFTSGGTESNVLAIQTLLQHSKKNGKHIITTSIEHASLLNYFNHLENNHGYKITYLSVNEEGLIDMEELTSSITEQTQLVSIQHANPELGAIQPIEKVGALLRGQAILFHSDCVQTFGKLPIHLDRIYVDSISISSHKVYGPKGVGAVYVRKGLDDKSGFYSGTVNVPGIAAFVTASQDVIKELDKEQARLCQLRTNFIKLIKERSLPVEVFTSSRQLPNIIGLFIDSIQGDYVMLEFNRVGIAVSTGSACSVGQQEPSKAILGIGKTPERAKQFVRLSVGKDTVEEHLRKVLDVSQQMISSPFDLEIELN